MEWSTTFKSSSITLAKILPLYSSAVLSIDAHIQRSFQAAVQMRGEVKRLKHSSYWAKCCSEYMGYVILIDSKSERAGGGWMLLLGCWLRWCSSAVNLLSLRFQNYRKKRDDGRTGGDGERHKRRKGWEGNDIKRRRIGRASSICSRSDCIEMQKYTSPQKPMICIIHVHTNSGVIVS